MKLLSKGILLTTAASIALASPAMAVDSYFFREKANVRPHDKGGKTPDNKPGEGTPTTPPGDNTASVSLTASGGFRLTQHEAVTGLSVGGSKPASATYHLAGTYPGLSIDSSSGAISGAPSAGHGTNYDFWVEVKKDGNVIGSSSHVTGTVWAALRLNSQPEDVNILPGGAWPTSGLGVDVIGGHQDSLVWSLINNPTWLGIQKTSGPYAMLTFSGAITEDITDRVVTIRVVDGQNRSDQSRTFKVTAKKLSDVTVALQDPGNLLFTKSVTTTINMNVTGSGDNITYHLTSDSTPGFNVDVATGRVWGSPANATGTPVSLKVEARQNGNVIATSNAITGIARDYFEVIQGPNTINVNKGEPFPTASIFAEARGGNIAGYTWTLENAPSWLEIVKTDATHAKLQVKAGGMADADQTVTLKLVDGEGRVDTSRTFGVKVQVAPAFTISYAASSPHVLTKDVYSEFPVTVSDSSNVRYYMKTGSTSGFTVGEYDGKVQGKPGSYGAYSFTVEAKRNGELIGTSNTVTGSYYDLPLISGGNDWGGSIASRSGSSHTLNISGGEAPYNVTIKSGTMPDWAEAVVSGNTVIIRVKSGATVTATPNRDIYFSVTDKSGRVPQNATGHKVGIQAY